MSEPIHVYAQDAIKDGKVSEVEALMKRLVESCRDDDGVLNYQFFLNEARTVMHAIEIYRDGAALLAHLGHVGELMGPLMELVTVNRLVVTGDPPAPVRDALAPMNPLYLTHLAGFTR